MSADRHSPLIPFLAACAGVGLFSVMDAVMKGLVLAIGVYNTMIWRNGMGAIVAGLSWRAMGGVRPEPAVLRLHVWRGIVLTFVGLSFFWAIGRLPLAEAIALSFIAPLIALYLAAIMLGERIGRSAIWASVLGLAGVVVIGWGKFGQGDYPPDAPLGVAAVFASAIFFAYNLILARQQAQLAKPLEIVFFQNLTVTVTLAFAAPWLLAVPAGEHWPMIALACALAIVSLLLMSWAYARAEAQILIPTEYTAFIWAVICGWIFFSEPVEWTTMAGAALIVIGCLIATRARPQAAEPVEIAAV